MSLQKILAEYDSNVEEYEILANRFKDLMDTLLIDKKRGINSIICRVKKRDSLEKKVIYKEYTSFEDINDIIGIRIITYFEDDVQEIGEIISSNFEIDQEKSSDTSSRLKDNEFGYKSIHYIARFSKARRSLAEYNRIPGLTFEFQIRSILQHAWAEIEHDLGYKSQEEVPRKIKRRFSRLAGLLELADEEFITVRKEKNAYSKELKSTINNTEKISEIEIDSDSLREFVDSEYMLDISKEIAAGAGLKLSRSQFEIFTDHRFYSAYIYLLYAVTIDAIGILKGYIDENRERIVRFAVKRLKESIKHDSDTTLGVDISMFYTAYAISITKANHEMFKTYVQTSGISLVNHKNIDDLYYGLLVDFEEASKDL